MHCEIMLTKYLSNIDPSNRFPCLLKDIDIWNILVFRLQISIRQYEIRVVKFDLVRLVIQLYGRVFGYMERLELIGALGPMILALYFERLTRFSHLMANYFFFKDRRRTLVLSLDFVDSQFDGIFSGSRSLNRIELHLVV